MHTTSFGQDSHDRSVLSTVHSDKRHASLLKTCALQDAIFNSAYFSSIATDEHGVIQIFNVGAERMLGYKALDVLNRITPADISDPVELIARAAALSEELDTPISPGFNALVFKASRGIEDIYELTYIRQDGSRLPAIVSVTALRNSRDEIIGYLLIGTDNTTRKRFEHALEARAADLQRFRTAMDATADAITLVSRDSLRFVEVNATSYRMLGYTRAEMLALGPAGLGAVTRAELTCTYDSLIAGHASATLSETALHCKDGSQIQVEVSRQAMLSGNDWIIVSVVRDITERRQAQQRLQHQANHDALTGLPNRSYFYETLRKTIVLASQQGWKVAVMFIDLDHFKNVNDTLGHSIGDELLIHFSNRLMACVRMRDTIGRLGGDEFGLILVMELGHQGAAQVATKVRDALHAPFNLHGYELVITASIGITIYPDDGCDRDALIKYADTAMYQAKHAGRNTYRFFTAQMNVDVLQRQDLEIALRKAIEREEFELHYQPKVSLATGAVVGLEALLRWARPGHGLVAPALFIPVLEESGLIVRVGSWVIASACRQIKEWQNSKVGAVQVSVNVAARQFIEGDLEADVARALADNGIAAGLLELELTETSLMLNTERIIVCLSNLRERGVKVSIDDFGTGYSSLAYLRRFPIDKLKIDIAFIRDVTSNPDDAAIVMAIVTMAHSLSLVVIAEGVETLAQQSYLLRHRCDQIQGYLVSRPLPATQITELMLLRKTLIQPAPPAGMGQTLLIVDDDPFIRQLLATKLEGEQYRVLVAQSAAQAFEMLAQNEVQVILCDQSMPEMEGTMFLDSVKTMYPNTFRIVLSGDTNLEDMMAAVNRGAVDRFYAKPWDHEVLLNSIRQAFLHLRLAPELGKCS